MRWQKQVFIGLHTRLSRAYLALARLSCCYLSHRQTNRQVGLDISDQKHDPNQCCRQGIICICKLICNYVYPHRNWRANLKVAYGEVVGRWWRWWHRGWRRKSVIEVGLCGRRAPCLNVVNRDIHVTCSHCVHCICICYTIVIIYLYSM